MKDRIKILLVEDNPGDARLIEIALAEAGGSNRFALARVDELSKSFELLIAGDLDAILLDLNLPDSQGLDTLVRLMEKTRDLPIIILTGFADEALIMQALQMGAQDYLVKDQLDGNLLRRSIRHAIERKQAEHVLHAADLRYQALIEHASDGISLLGPDGHIKYTSPSTQRILGYIPEEETVEFDPAQMILPDDLPGFLSILSELIQRPNETVTAQYRFKHKDSSYRWLESTMTNLLTEPSVEAVVFNFRDITERKETEQSLRESEASLKKSQAVAHIGHWTWDTRANMVYWSDEMKNIFGIAPEDFDGHLDQVIQNAIHPDDRQEVLAMNEAVRLDGKPQTAEYRIVLKDGSIRHIWAEPGESVQDERGNIIQLSGIVQDITERKHAEETLLLQGMALDTAVNAVVISNREGLIEWVNPAFTTLTGYTVSEAVGKNPCQLVKSGRQNQAVYKHMWDTILSGKAWSGELINRRKDGSLYNEEQTITPILNARGEITHFIAIKQDVTSRKQAETKIQLQLNHLQALRAIDIAITSSFDMNVTLEVVLQHVVFQLGVDAAAVLLVNLEEQRFDYASSRGFLSNALHHTQLKLNEGFAGRAMQERQIIHIADLPATAGILAEAMQLVNEKFISYYGVPLIVKGKVIGVLEVFNRTVVERDNEWLDLLGILAGQAAVAVDNAQLFSISQRELTERRRAEKELRQLNAELEGRIAERTADLNRTNIELERSLRVKDEFLANMSHELRTPLNAILGLSESLAEQTAGELNEKQQKYVHTINESGTHLLTLINDILDLAKIEAGQITLDRSRVDINSLCQASLRMIKQLALKKNLEVAFQVDGQLDLIWADERRLKQMIINLLSNAVKFTPHDRKIGLAVSGNRDENKVMFTIWDDGIGIKEEDLARLFRPFVQLDSDLAREATGTGLGLALVAEMARLHGGSVEATSQFGAGSQFTIVLPWESALASDTLSRMKITGKFRAVKPGDKRQTILLVEDTEEVIMVVRDYLEYAGYKVEIAKNGLEGIAQAKQIHPDLILMDVQMPELNGLQATQRLRSDEEFRNTPVIALTALAMKGDRERCLAAGMDEYMSKPVSLKALVKMIQMFLS